MIQYNQYDEYAGDIGMLKNPNIFYIHWSPDIFCNYKCSYCFPGSNSTDRHHLPIDVLIKGLHDLKFKINHVLGIPKIDLTFSGGEPTLVPGFLQLIEAYDKDNSENQTLSICTNLTRGKKWWNEFLEVTKSLKSITINASWHRESVGDVNIARQKFLEIGNLFKSHKRNFRITMVLPPSQFDDIYSDALFFRKNDIRTLIRVERKYIEKIMGIHPDYNIDMINDIINWNKSNHISFVRKEKDSEEEQYNNVEQAIALGKTNYLNWKCYAGTSSVIIKPDGSIKRAWSCRDAPIGNIKNANYSLSEEPQKCITPRCGCSSDMNSPKIKFI